MSTHGPHARLFVSILLTLSLVAAACSSSAEGSPATPTATQAFVPLADCPVTIPAKPHAPSAPYLAEPPGYYKTAWYGSDSLWTMLAHDGANWNGLPMGAGGFSQKTWWWSQSFELNKERTPAITVTGKRLDALGEFMAGNPGTHGSADFGTAMLVGIEIPTAGCWEIRAHYKDAELAFIALVK